MKPFASPLTEKISSQRHELIDELPRISSDLICDSPSKTSTFHSAELTAAACEPLKSIVKRRVHQRLTISSREKLTHPICKPTRGKRVGRGPNEREEVSRSRRKMPGCDSLAGIKGGVDRCRSWDRAYYRSAEGGGSFKVVRGGFSACAATSTVDALLFTSDRERVGKRAGREAAARRRGVASGHSENRRAG